MGANSTGIAGSGTFTVNGSAALTGGGVSGKTLVLNGNSTLNDGSVFFIVNSGVLRIAATATLTIGVTCNNCIAIEGSNLLPPGTIDNQGTIVKNGSNPIRIHHTIFNSSGNLQINGGTLQIYGKVGGNFTAGTTILASGAVLELNGFQEAGVHAVFNFTGGNFNGGGKLHITRRCTATFSPGFSLSCGIELGGVLNPSILQDNVGVTPAFCIITSNGTYRGTGNPVVSGDLTITGGSNGGVIVYIGASGTFTVCGDASINGGYIRGKRLILKGNTEIDNGYYVSHGATLDIDDAGYWLIDHCGSDKVIVNGDPANPGRIIVHGQLDKTGCGKAILDFNHF